MKLAPIADRVAAAMLKKADVAAMLRDEKDVLGEMIVDEIYWATGGELDWEPTNIVIGMVEKRIKKLSTAIS